MSSFLVLVLFLATVGVVQVEAYVLGTALCLPEEEDPREGRLMAFQVAYRLPPHKSPPNIPHGLKT